MWFKAKNFLTGMVGALIAVCLLLSMWAVSGYGYWEGLIYKALDCLRRLCCWFLG